MANEHFYPEIEPFATGELQVDSVMRLVPLAAVMRLVDEQGLPLTATNGRRADLELLAFGAVDIRLATTREALAAAPFTPFTNALVQAFDAIHDELGAGER